MFDAEYVKKIKLFIFKTVHFLLTVILFYFTFLIFRYNEFPLVKDVGFRYNYLVTGGFILALLFFNHTYNSHLFGYSRIRTLIFAQFLSQLFSTGIIYFSVCLAWNHIQSPALFFLFLLICLVIDIFSSYVGNNLYFMLNPPRKTTLIYRNTRDRRRFGTIKGKPTERLYEIVKEVQFDGTFDNIKSDLIGFEAVFVAGLNSHCRN